MYYQWLIRPKQAHPEISGTSHGTVLTVQGECSRLHASPLWGSQAPGAPRMHMAPILRGIFIPASPLEKSMEGPGGGASVLVVAHLLPPTSSGGRWSSAPSGQQGQWGRQRGRATRGRVTGVAEHTGQWAGKEERLSQGHYCAVSYFCSFAFTLFVP